MVGYLSLSLYTWIMIAFLLLLILVLVIGDIGHIDFGHDAAAGDVGPVSPLSLPIIASFGVAFGGFGTIYEVLGFGPVATPILAAASAGLLAAGMYVAMVRVFARSQAATRVDPAALQGIMGQVLVPIAPGRPGQVVVITDARGRTLLPAVADEEIATHEDVIVIGNVGQSVKVRKA